MRSQEKLKILNLHYFNVYGHQICQGCDVLLGACTLKVIWLFNLVVLWGHMTNYICYFPICRKLAGTKLGKVVTSCERNHRKSHMVSPWWHNELTINYSISPLSQDLWPLNLAWFRLQGGRSERKHLSRHRFLEYIYFYSYILLLKSNPYDFDLQKCKNASGIVSKFCVSKIRFSEDKIILVQEGIHFHSLHLTHYFWSSLRFACWLSVLIWFIFASN